MKLMPRLGPFVRAFLPSGLLALAVLAAAAGIGAAAGPGAIWTTRFPCSDPAPQNENHYQTGETVYVRGSNFQSSTTYGWMVTGQPGNASSDPGVVVGSGTVTTDGGGAFCLAAYTIPPGDRGEYTVDLPATDKNDNYRVSASAPTLTPTPDGGVGGVTPTPTPTPSPTPEGGVGGVTPTPTPTPTATPTPSPTPERVVEGLAPTPVPLGGGVLAETLPPTDTVGPDSGVAGQAPLGPVVMLMIVAAVAFFLRPMRFLLSR